jgi:6-pyruvoyltetrahydropterin/6-carboxytetrahydropterin synthase
MYRLSRTVRFSINPRAASRERGTSGYSGNPPPRGFAHTYELVVDCVGALGSRTSYVINIKEIDRAVRESVVPLIERTLDAQSLDGPEELMPSVLDAASKALPNLVSRIAWKLSPYHALEMSTSDTTRVVLRQRFDFCAAHRLHNPALTSEENAALFGKCNNASGHGHNYQIEPAVAVRLFPGRRSFTLDQLEAIVDREVIQRFDHRNLNADTAEFKDGLGAMPSVEHISRVCYELIDRAIRAEAPDASLVGVTVWESDRTSSTYPG